MRCTLYISLLAVLAPLVAHAAPVGSINDVETVHLTSANETVSSHVLDKRAAKCSKASQCKQTVPSNAQRTCASQRCSWACKSGYAQSGSQCVKQAVAKVDSNANVQLAARNALTASGVKSFQGTNTGAVASWYHTNSPADSTNGHSWCLFRYADNVPGFAVSLKTMLDDFNGDENKARAAYCGLEAVVTTASGTSMKLYITDAFDPAWVRTPTSMDVIYNAFTTLNGGVQTNDKNVVQNNVSWRFTGNRNPRYAVNGAGSG